MIKCGKLKGKDGEVANQCILYSKDGSKALGYFLYSEHGGQKGAKAAARKREGAVQFFKQKHQGLLDALEAFGAPAVLKYLLGTGCTDCQQVVKAHVAEWLEKARGEGQDQSAEELEVAIEVFKRRWGRVGGEKPVRPPTPGRFKAPVGWNDPRSWLKSGKDAAKIRKQVWESMGSSVTTCIGHMKDRVEEPGRFCAALKDAIEGKEWRKGPRKKKSFAEETEDALTLLQKDEDTEMELDDIDLSKLEAWLAGEEAADVETESTEPEPEPESDVEPEPAGPEPEPEEEQPLDFRTFLLRDHARKRANIMAMLGEEVDNEHGD